MIGTGRVKGRLLIMKLALMLLMTLVVTLTSAMIA